MSKLMTISQWQKANFPDKSPTRQTIANWCRKGNVPAKQIGKKWFIVVEQAGNPLVDRVLGQ